MKSKARIGRHPIHPMLVCLPIGLWVFSCAADIIYLYGGREVWRMVAAYCLGGGCAGALLAALPGIIDYLFITDPGSKRVATWHMVLNLALTALYAGNFFLRYRYDYDPAGIPFVLSMLGMVILGVSGWLGGHLIYVHKVGVDEDEDSYKTQQGGLYDKSSKSTQESGSQVHWAAK